MQVGDLVEGFATSILGLKGILTKVQRGEFVWQGTYHILWSDGTHRKHKRHQFTTEL